MKSTIPSPQLYRPRIVRALTACSCKRPEVFVPCPTITFTRTSWMPTPKKIGLYPMWSLRFVLTTTYMLLDTCIQFPLQSMHRLTGDSDAVNLSCAFQRSWILLTNICHGVLAGLALAHILFVVTVAPKDLIINSVKSFTSSTEIYTNTFYCLSILCLVSIFDRYVQDTKSKCQLMIW